MTLYLLLMAYNSMAKIVNIKCCLILDRIRNLSKFRKYLYIFAIRSIIKDTEEKI